MLTQELAAARGGNLFDLGQTASRSSTEGLTFGRGAPGQPAIGIAVIGADDTIAFCNAEYLELWGLSRRARARDAGGPWARVENPEMFRRSMGAIRFRSDGLHTRKVVHLGDGRSIELVSAPVRDAADRGLKRIMFVRDAGWRQASDERSRKVGPDIAGLAGLVGVLALLVAVLSVWPQSSRANLLSGDGAIASIDTSQAR